MDIFHKSEKLCRKLFCPLAVEEHFCLRVIFHPFDVICVNVAEKCVLGGENAAVYFVKIGGGHFLFRAEAFVYPVIRLLVIVIDNGTDKRSL